MDQDDILRRFSPDMSPENTGEDFLSILPVSFPSYPQKSLDLHGRILSEIKHLVKSFLRNSLQENLLFARIITGHGKESSQGYSVIRSETREILEKWRSEKKIFRYTIGNGYFDVFLNYWE